MDISLVWEHNGPDTLLYAIDLPGAFTRGESFYHALDKLPGAVRGYLRWMGRETPEEITGHVVQEADCDLTVQDADSDVLFDSERLPLSRGQYAYWKALALKSAEDFLRLYEAIPDKKQPLFPARRTFYGQIPRTAKDIYLHTKNVNDYYFSEINVPSDHEGDILDCRRRGFAELEKQPDFLENPVLEGSYGEFWSLAKVLRRFLWHDRIHARGLYRHAVTLYPDLPDIFCFQEEWT